MVFTAAPMPFMQMPPPVASAITHGMGSGTHIGNIPQHIVPSTIVTPEVQNNRQGVMPSHYGQTGTVHLFTAPPNLQAYSPANGLPNHSVAFFAQLLAQSDPQEQLSLTSTFRDPVPFPVTKAVMRESSVTPALTSGRAEAAVSPRATLPQSSAPVVSNADVLEPVKQPNTVYTRKYQIAQRYHNEAQQIKVDVNKLMQGAQSRETLATTSSAAAGASSSGNSRTLREFSGTEPRADAREAKQHAPNNMVYQPPTVNYGQPAHGVNAYLSTLSLFNPPPVSPVLRVL